MKALPTTFFEKSWLVLCTHFFPCVPWLSCRKGRRATELTGAGKKRKKKLSVKSGRGKNSRGGSEGKTSIDQSLTTLLLLLRSCLLGSQRGKKTKPHFPNRRKQKWTLLHLLLTLRFLTFSLFVPINLVAPREEERKKLRGEGGREEGGTMMA